VGPSGDVLPAGSPLPAASAAVAQQIRDNDNVEGVVRLVNAFADGRATKYWDFGPTPDFGAPIYILVEENSAGQRTRLPDTAIVDVIPGDPAYSPYWPVFEVVVTAAYAGEVIPSAQALAEAERLGLVRAPEDVGQVINCPVVADDVTLEVGGGEPPAPPKKFFWRGHLLSFYDFGEVEFNEDAEVVAQDAYRLRRSGGEFIDETLLGVDITDDGDRWDTNNIFSSRVDEESYTSLCRWREIAVPGDTVSIDTNKNDTLADLTSRLDLFNPMPLPGRVLAIEDVAGFTNCPQQVMLGGQ